MPKLARPSAHVEFYCDYAGEYRWRLRSANGAIIAESGESYSKQGHEVRAWNTVSRTVLRGVNRQKLYVVKKSSGVSKRGQK